MTEVRDEIFHDMMGEDNHGYCRTYGRAVPHKAVYKRDHGLSQAFSSSTVVEITNQVRAAVTQEIEARMTQKFMAQFKQMRARIEFLESQGGTIGKVSLLPSAC